MLSGSLISTVPGTRYPGPGTIYLGQKLRFLKPVHVGDTDVTVSVRSLAPATCRVVLTTRCVDQEGDIVIEGEADVIAPAPKKLRIRRIDLPSKRDNPHRS